MHNKVNKAQPDKKAFEATQKFISQLHRVFVQNEDGAEILSYWKHDLMMTDGSINGSNPYQIGIVEGKKQFVRKLINMINQAEGK